MKTIGLLATIGLAIMALPTQAFEKGDTVYLRSPGGGMAPTLNEVFVWSTPEVAAKAPVFGDLDYALKDRTRSICIVRPGKKAKVKSISNGIAEVDITISSCEGFVRDEYLQDKKNGYEKRLLD
jgi:hypothetical protein